MIYLYESATGEQIEREFPMGEAPREVDGHKRVLTVPQLACKPNVRFADYQSPLNYKYHRGGFLPDGTPVFDSKRQVDETVACANHHGENLRWDR